MRIFSTKMGVVFTLLLSACSDAPHSGIFGKSDLTDSLYTTRGEIDEPHIFILRLKSPALLESAERTDGVLSVDPEALANVEREQAEAIAELKGISSEIQVIYRYKSVLNGLAIWAPGDTYEKVQKLKSITKFERSGIFQRAQVLEEDALIMKIGKNTSVKFIGAEAAYKEGFKGQGMKVGIIDTGIDYTHKMFMGEGTPEAFKAIDPTKPTSSFPNKKVVGGIDLAGSKFSAGSADPSERIPQPDSNPIDEADHGTHVAGSVAGIGDGLNTYDGVAPEADLYAIKVFGAKGSTTDAIVIAALEYAVDPTQDLTFRDQLDVVNLSLGGGYGNPHIMYAIAIKNLVNAGTVVVASAGNAGDKPYIVGAPSISNEAISVASSVDNQEHNVAFPALEYSINNTSKITEALEAAITLPLDKVASLQGEVIDLGLGNVVPSDPSAVKGKIALIQRGAIAFADKIGNAQKWGAIAAVIYQNSDEAPILMGGDGAFDIPAVMIDLETGSEISEALKSGSVKINLKTSQKIEKSFLIDTISTFSSRGPRSEDGVIKPEITAPGTNIISAEIGLGDKGSAKSGTSMSGPHIAGVAALLKQKHPELSVEDLKSLMLGQAKQIHDEKRTIYPVSRQGAGRVQVAASFKAKVVSSPATLSYGITDIEKQKTLSLQVKLKNISTSRVSLQPHWKGSEALSILAPTVSLNAGEEKSITIKAILNGSKMESENEDLDGFLTFVDGKNLVLQMPALVVARQISQIKAKSLTVHATSDADSSGSLSELVIENKGANAGVAYLFNLLGQDNRKPKGRDDYAPNRNCDLQSAGYRIIGTEGKRVLQVAVKLYEGMTTWHACELNVQIDSDNDNKADQELAGLPMESLAGLESDRFISLLLDGDKARALRKKFESQVKVDPTAKEDYTTAVQDQRRMEIFDNSTLAIIEADISLLKLSTTGELNIKISTTHQDAGTIEYDDYLENHSTHWKKISVHPMAQSYAELPDVVELNGKESQTISLLKGYGAENLVIYAPQNKSVRDFVLEDAQSEVVNPQYLDQAR